MELTEAQLSLDISRMIAFEDVSCDTCGHPGGLHYFTQPDHECHATLPEGSERTFCDCPRFNPSAPPVGWDKEEAA